MEAKRSRWHFLYLFFFLQASLVLLFIYQEHAFVRALHALQKAEQLYRESDEQYRKVVDRLRTEQDPDTVQSAMEEVGWTKMPLSSVHILNRTTP